MGLTIRQIRDNTTRARHLMQRTRQQHFAVGAFNVDNQETLISICRAAQKLNSPVLVQVNDTEAKALGVENVRDLIDNYKIEYGIEIYINLDHSTTVEDCKRAIDAGYEFVQIDASLLSHDVSDEEIIDKTKEIVDYARFTGALVEGELSYFGKDHDIHSESFDRKEIRNIFSTPEESKAFVDATGVDIFAAAVGNLHGKYGAAEKLDLELLAKIRDSITTQISLHGGSGISLNLLTDAVKIGVSKVSIGSDLRYAFRTALEKELKENPDQFVVTKLMDDVKDAMQKIVEDKINAFGSAGRAVV